VILARGLKQERGLAETAVLYDGLADLGCLAVEVLNATPREGDARVGFCFAARPLLPFFGGFVDGKLIF
jgi:hypothetical protein